MPHEITLAEDVAHVARKLIRDYHKHLKDASIVYLFTTAKRKSKGRTVLATAQLPDDVLRFFSGADGATEADFIILVGKAEWEKLDDKKREALVDHELCHCQRGDDDKDGDPTWKTRGHDLEEFADVVRRHGLWEDGIKQFAESLQMALPAMECGVTELERRMDEKTKEGEQLMDKMFPPSGNGNGNSGTVTGELARVPGTSVTVNTKTGEVVETAKEG